MTLSETRICLPFKLFHAAFDKLRTHGHAGTKISARSFSHYSFIAYIHKCISMFIHDCIECSKK